MTQIVVAEQNLLVRDARTRRLLARIRPGTKGRVLAKNGFRFLVDWEGHGVQEFEHDPDSFALREEFSSGS